MNVMRALFPHRAGPGLSQPSERVFGTPGAALSVSGLPPDLVAAGLRGEQAVGGVLNRLAASAGVYVFHSLMPDAKADMDHAVLAGNTLILVDAKNWAGGHQYTLCPDSKTVLRDGAPFAGGHTALSFVATLWRKRFPRLRVRAVLCVARDDSSITGTGAGFDFVTLGDLSETITGLLAGRASRDAFATDVRKLASMTVIPAGVAGAGGHTAVPVFTRARVLGWLSWALAAVGVLVFAGAVLPPIVGGHAQGSWLLGLGLLLAAGVLRGLAR